MLPICKPMLTTHTPPHACGPPSRLLSSAACLTTRSPARLPPSRASWPPSASCSARAAFQRSSPASSRTPTPKRCRSGMGMKTVRCYRAVRVWDMLGLSRLHMSRMDMHARPESLHALTRINQLVFGMGSTARSCACICSQKPDRVVVKEGGASPLCLFARRHRKPMENNKLHAMHAQLWLLARHSLIRVTLAHHRPLC